MDDHIEQEALRIFATQTESQIEAALIEDDWFWAEMEKPSYVLALKKIDQARLNGTLEQELSDAKSQFEPTVMDRFNTILGELPDDVKSKIIEPTPFANFVHGQRSYDKAQRERFIRAKNAILPLIADKPKQEWAGILNDICAPMEKAKGGKRGKPKSTLVEWDSFKEYSDAVLVKIQQRKNPNEYSDYSVFVEFGDKSLNDDRFDNRNTNPKTRHDNLKKWHKMRMKLREL